MMVSLPPLPAVRAFEAAARHSNFSRAAEELAMTQAGVSYQMKVLEDRLGAPLFVRRGRTMELTALGALIAPRISEAFRIMGEAFAVARTESSSVLSITAPRTFATNWLAGRLGGFHAAHPDIAVRLEVSDTLVELDASEFDVAIRGLPAAPEGLASHFLMRMPVTPLASPAYLALNPLRNPEDLLGATRISPDDDWWELWFGAAQLPRSAEHGRSGVRLESQVLDGLAAIAGYSVAILSPPMFRSAIDGGLLVQPFDLAATYRNGFWLVYPEHRKLLPKVSALRDWLMTEVAAEVGTLNADLLEPLPAPGQ